MKTRRPAAVIPAVIPAVLMGLVAGTAVAQKPDAAPDTDLGCDPSAITWFIPGQFQDARERARSEKRLLIIKGISFGVDAAGARCATKGKW